MYQNERSKQYKCLSVFCAFHYISSKELIVLPKHAHFMVDILSLILFYPGLTFLDFQQSQSLLWWFHSVEVNMYWKLIRTYSQAPQVNSLTLFIGYPLCVANALRFCWNWECSTFLACSTAITYVAIAYVYFFWHTC